MKIAVVSFTRNGAILNKKISKSLNCEGYTINRFSNEFNLKPLEKGLSTWTEEMFKVCDGIIFIGACGIAVRSIAPYIKSKTTDPCVIVVDEMGKYTIPILSGHIGGGNSLAREISAITKGECILSTATDINNKFAVDVFAVKNNLYISDMKIAKEISARVLEGEKIGFISELDVKGRLPSELSSTGDIGIYIGLDDSKKPFKTTLNLVPKVVSLGIGCRKNTSLKAIEDLATWQLEKYKISKHAIEGVFSIDIKKEEKGIIDFADKINAPFKTFSSEELLTVKGEFTKSNFVKSITGVDNVCERSAVLGNCGQLLIKKTSKNGVTFAASVRKWGIDFEN